MPQTLPLKPIPPAFIDGKRRTRRRVVALTFDACWSIHPAGYDAGITTVLRRTQTSATIFFGGLWMQNHADVTRHLAIDPLFEMGNHSWGHPHMTRLSPAQMRDQLLRTQEMQYHLTGRQGTVFRPPFGDCNAPLVRVAASVGLRTIGWNVETGDPDKHQTAPLIVRDTFRAVHPGSIIIMHINGRGWHSAEALPIIIARLRHQGYQFVTVSQLLREL